MCIPGVEEGGRREEGGKRKEELCRGRKKTSWRDRRSGRKRCLVRLGSIDLLLGHGVGGEGGRERGRLKKDRKDSRD